MHVKVSKGNTKMGAIPSVSLPPIKTCRVCECFMKCYAKKLMRFRPTVSASYENNLELLLSDPDTYWREVESAILLTRFFRFHVAGDIPDQAYFYHMIEISKRNSHCQILCFTKRYDIVNNALRQGISIPHNLHIIFSAWPRLEMDNPYSLPEAHVRFKDGTTTARPDALECDGNCTKCAETDGGCWTLACGQQVVFKEH